MSTSNDQSPPDLDEIRERVRGLEGREMDAHEAAIEAMGLATYVPALLAEIDRLRTQGDSASDEWQGRHDAITEIIVQAFPSAHGFYEYASNAADQIMPLPSPPQGAR